MFLFYRTDEDSFQKVKNWVKELKKMLGSEVILAIVGNKVDLNKDRVVAFEMAERYSKYSRKKISSYVNLLHVHLI